MAQARLARGARRAEPDENERDPDKLAQEELVRLQRQYRKMEMERSEVSIQSGATVLSQQPRVLWYERQRDEMLADLNNLLTDRNNQQDQQTVNTILDLVDKFDAHQAAVEHEVSEISELNVQVSIITKSVIHQKLKVQAIFGHSMTPGQAEKQRGLLENRLYRFTREYDTQVSRNHALRIRINAHLTDRGQFHEKYRSTKKRIARMKRYMFDLVDVATATYDQREECVTKIKALRERNDKESRAHVLEMKECHRLLHNDEKSRAFMKTKSKSRRVIEEEHVRLRRLQNTKETQYDELLKAYRKSFSDILKMSNCPDIPSVLRIYLAHENKNFSKFQYLSTLNSELDFIQRAVTELQSVIEVKNSEHKGMQSDQLKSLKLLETQFEEAVAQKAQRQEYLGKCTTNLDTMIKSLETIFHLANCDKEPIMRLLGQGEKGQPKIMPENVDLCLTLLEKRIQELQREDAILEIRKAVEIDRVPLGTAHKAKSHPHSAASSSHSSHSHRPNMGGFQKPQSSMKIDAGAGVEEEDDKAAMSLRPLTYPELKAELLVKYQRNAAAIEAVKEKRASRVVPVEMQESNYSLLQ